MPIFGAKQGIYRASFRQKFIRVSFAPWRLTLSQTNPSTVIHTDNRTYLYPISRFVMPATRSSAEKSILGKSRPPDHTHRPRPQPQTLSDWGVHARTWYFTFDLQASDSEAWHPS